MVCAKCGRWNLTPLEERWEAVEECERQYRGTIKRSSTDQIGLGRVREGTDLIRIGNPLRPELAAWRYGRHFQHRKRVARVLLVAGSVAQAGTLFTGGGLFMAGILGASLVLRLQRRRSEIGRAKQFIAQKAGDEFGKKVWMADTIGVRIIPSDHEQGWGLRFALDGKFADFHGYDALHTAHLIAPAMNAEGGSASAVNVAVRDIEIAGSPQQYFARVLKYGQTRGWQYTGIGGYPEHMRLAFEMAAHEETERAALEGELRQLENDWREAEEIASIADNLFLPKSVTDFIARHRPS